MPSTGIYGKDFFFAQSGKSQAGLDNQQSNHLPDKIATDRNARVDLRFLLVDSG